MISFLPMQKPQNLLFFLIVVFKCFGQGPSLEIQKLEKQIYSLNNNFEYDKSQQILFEGIKNPALTPEDKFYHYLFLSFTYKRLFDYPKVIEFLEKAKDEGNRTKHTEFFNTIFQCEMAYVFFDIQKYDAADSIMNKLAVMQYKYISPSNKASLIMQQAYLKYINDDNKKAESLYLSAIDIMKETEPCNLPNIYVKCIQLYAKLKDVKRVKEYANKAIHIADSCNIIKYKIYTYEMLEAAYIDLDSFKASVRVRKSLDTLTSVYNREQYALNLANLELKYNAEVNEKIASKQRFIHSLYTIAIIATSLIALILFFIGRKLRLQKRKLTKQNALRQNLIQILSHDIKEPLLSAQILTEKIKLDISSPRDLASQINNQLSLTKSILKNMIALIQEEKPETLTHPDVVRILNSIVEKLFVKINEKKLKVVVDETIKIESQLKISAAVLESLLTNLIINAIKYSFLNGEINISFDKKSIYIQDNGTGVSKEVLSDIGNVALESKEGTHGERGTGLGLYLINQMLKDTNISFAFKNMPVGVSVEISIN